MLCQDHSFWVMFHVIPAKARLGHVIQVMLVGKY
jgi:hypothetical protein